MHHPVEPLCALWPLRDQLALWYWRGLRRWALNGSVCRPHSRPSEEGWLIYFLAPQGRLIGAAGRRKMGHFFS